MKAAGLGAAAMCVALAIAGPADAQDKPTLSGSWTASALTESWSVTDWGEACGPKPAGKGAGGGGVQIREQGGELSIIGAGRAFSTAECWEQMPGLARTSHSSSGGGRFWRTRCTSAANDPRRAVVTTSISATDNSIQLSETGEYQFIIKDTTCRASVSRARSFSLVRRDGDTPPAPSASASASAAPAASTAAPAAPPPPREPDPKPSSRCTGSAGDPAKLEVHPGKKLMRAGDRFTFRAVVTDAEGCPTGTRPTWSILPGPLASKASVDASGTVTLAADAGEGKLDLSASVGGKGVTVPVEVASPDHYDALLGASGLNDAGEADQAAVAVIAVGTIGGRTTVAEDAGRERKLLFVAIASGIALVLGFVGLVMARRGRRPVVEPSADLDEAPPLEEAPPSAPAAAPPAAAARPARKARGKICPTCGEQYPGEADFCGKDGTKLVPLNG
ncbi:Hypothetical protein A7982_08612 [Minicystis rosea]|nr:Hypothetical protein A7982_08612 [Minicystis rosea]